MQTNNSSNQVKPDEFRVGDIVWDLTYGKGMVVDLDDDDTPVEVAFEIGHNDWFSQDGKLEPSLNRTLFFSEPKVVASVTRPFAPTLVGKRVVVLEYACYPQVFVVTWEDASMFGNDDYKFVKSNSIVYEISQENRLKP